METRKLNLGCGQYKKTGHVNIDWDKSGDPEIVHNLENIPYPFSNDFFDLIEADHLLEHLSDVFGVVKEMHRIAKKDAKIIIRVPHYSRGLTHPEHKRGFDYTFPFYFKKGFPGGYQGFELKCESIKMHWFAQEYLKKQVLITPLFLAGKMVGKFIDFFANLSPMFCSRVWCYWVGGFEEIEFKFRVIK